jgi:type II secretory pathway predicted ATPase ExeA
MAHQDVLEHLHILANHECDARALLSLVLVGLPEMRDRLSLHKNRSLWSRVHTRVCLGEASSADTAEYVAYRMNVARVDDGHRRARSLRHQLTWPVTLAMANKAG